MASAPLRAPGAAAGAWGVSSARRVVPARRVAPAHSGPRRAAAPRPAAAGAGAGSTAEPAAHPGLSLLDCVVPFVQPAAALLATGAYTGAVLGDAPPLLRTAALAAGPLTMHVLMPLADMLLGPRSTPPTEGRAPSVHDIPARALPLAYLAAHAAVAAAAYGAIAATPQQPPLLHLALLSYSIGTSAAVGIAAVHELLHGKHPLQAAAAAAHLVLHAFYPYFRDHPEHHRVVATPSDYTSAPKGLAFYAYFPRYVASSYAEAWQLAAAECKRSGHPAFSIHNSTLVAYVAQAAALAAIAAAFGPVVLAVHLAASFLCIFYVAMLDYALHYGLSRPPAVAHANAAPAAATAAARAGGASGGASGGGSGSGHHNAVRYSPVTPYTSWNSRYPLEDALLFNVLMHSEHHLTAAKSHGWLRVPAAAPTYPGPINLLGPLALLPPVWRAVMDARADAANHANDEYMRGVPAGGEDAPAAAWSG